MTLSPHLQPALPAGCEEEGPQASGASAASGRSHGTTAGAAANDPAAEPDVLAALQWLEDLSPDHKCALAIQAPERPFGWSMGRHLRAWTIQPPLVFATTWKQLADEGAEIRCCCSLLFAPCLYNEKGIIVLGPTFVVMLVCKSS